MKISEIGNIKKILIIFLSIFFIFSNGNAQYGKELCSNRQFTCVKVNKTDTWEKKWPNPTERDLIMRLNRTNLPLSKHSLVAVPKHLRTTNILDLSPFPIKVPPTGANFLLIDLAELAFGAYDPQGWLIHWGPISGGKNFCADLNRSCKTPLGTYQIYRIKGKNAISSQFPLDTKGGAPMPYCMRFYKGIALHGSNSLPGHHASHGCLRLYTEDAKWLNEKFVKIGTEIRIIDSKNPDSLSFDISQAHS